MTGAIVLGTALCAAVALGMVFRARDGRIRATESAAAEEPQRLAPVDLGGPLGERASLVHFSSAFCAPCRATRVLVDTIAEQSQGVRAIEVDAESNLDLVRRLDIRRTPTLLVLDGQGVIRRRATGLPKRSEVVAALADVV